MANFAVPWDFGLPNWYLSKKLIWTPYNCQKTTYYFVRHIGGAASELGFMHTGTIVEGEWFARIIACVVLSSEYVLKIPNERGWDLSFQHRSSTQCVPMFLFGKADKKRISSPYQVQLCLHRFAPLQVHLFSLKERRYTINNQIMAKLQNTPQVICFSLNNNGAYCFSPHFTKGSYTSCGSCGVFCSRSQITIIINLMNLRMLLARSDI